MDPVADTEHLDADELTDELTCEIFALRTTDPAGFALVRSLIRRFIENG